MSVYSDKSKSCRNFLGSRIDAKRRPLENVWRSLTHWSCCVFNEQINRSNQVCLTAVLHSWLLLNTARVGKLCMWWVWTMWDILKCSAELSILIAHGYKQGRQLGDSGRAQRCQNPLVYFLSCSFFFVCVLPLPQQHLPFLCQQWPLRVQGRLADERRCGGERKREHLVCRALISIALGEQVHPTFPHKNHKHTRTYTATHTLSNGWPLASTSLGLKGGDVQSRLQQECLSERMAESVQSTVPLWDSPLFIPLCLHFNWSCQKTEPKCEAKS